MKIFYALQGSNEFDCKIYCHPHCYGISKNHDTTNTYHHDFRKYNSSPTHRSLYLHIRLIQGICKRCGKRQSVRVNMEIERLWHVLAKNSYCDSSKGTNRIRPSVGCLVLQGRRYISRERNMEYPRCGTNNRNEIRRYCSFIAMACRGSLSRNGSIYRLHRPIGC